MEKLSVIAFLLLATTALKAQNVEDETVYELEGVTATASKIPTPINQTAKSVTVITQEQISQSPVQSIQDLLVYAASVDVIQRGGHGV